MLAGRHRPEADFDMGTRDGEVDDDVDRGIGEQRVDGLGASPSDTGSKYCPRR
jgi:hypothetical protein